MKPASGGGVVSEAIGSAGARSSATSGDGGGSRTFASSVCDGTSTCGPARALASARACLVFVSSAEVRWPGERWPMRSARLSALATAAWTASPPMTLSRVRNPPPASASDTSAARTAERRARDFFAARALRDRRIAAAIFGCRSSAFSTAPLGSEFDLPIKSTKRCAP